jgi:hypothetical protein
MPARGGGEQRHSAQPSAGWSGQQQAEREPDAPERAMTVLAYTRTSFKGEGPFLFVVVVLLECGQVSSAVSVGKGAVRIPMGTGP